MAIRQKASRVITKELAYLLSRLRTVDATTTRICIVNGQVVLPFAEGTTLPWLGFLADPPGITLAVKWGNVVSKLATF